MNIFLKDISHADIDLVSKFPIHGIIFSITEKKCEYTREIVEKLPFYIPVIGEIAPLPKYAIEEIIFFCKLNGIIITEKDSQEKLSCPRITYSGEPDWNVLIKNQDSYQTGKLEINEIHKKIPLAMVFTTEEFLLVWPEILNFWGTGLENR